MPGPGNQDRFRRSYEILGKVSEGQRTPAEIPPISLKEKNLVGKEKERPRRCARGVQQTGANAEA